LPFTWILYSSRIELRIIGFSSFAVSAEVMIWPFTAVATRRAARLTVSPNTSLSCWITGPAWKPMRKPSFAPDSIGIRSTAPCISAAAAAAASGRRKIASTSSPTVFTTRPPEASAALRIAVMHLLIAACAAASPAVS
jgi:hypothetical protein